MYGSYKKHKQPLHFVGIGGVGMSGIAEVLLRLGFPVSGSDANDSPTVQRLVGLGAKIFIGHKAENLVNAKVLVYSSAISFDNPEMQEAKRQGMPLVTRAEMLAELMRLKLGIAIAGTHGKTSTTSLVSAILTEAKLDPTVIVGGRVASLGCNAHLGTGDFLVAEADESDGSFLRLSPVISAVTNIDNDHMDFYSSMETLKRAFLEFINKTPYYGRAVLCSDDKIISELLPLVQRPFWTYGFDKQKTNHQSTTHLQITDYETTQDGCRFIILRNNQRLCPVALRFPGRHYALNATAAMAIALELDIDASVAAKALGGFTGVGRRFELKGHLHKPAVTIIDDYGHHPTEIMATLQAARSYRPRQRLVVAFQPHRYSRTEQCWDQFAPSLALADQIYLLDIYAAGETAKPGIDSATLAQAIASSGKSVVHSGDLKSTAKLLKSGLQDGDLLITLGAGSVTQLGPMLLGPSSV
jgi:UDP-N-acetylmuramate--alanine ligase